MGNFPKPARMSAVLVHFMVNFPGELCPLTQRAARFSLGLWVIAAVLVISRGGLQSPGLERDRAQKAEEPRAPHVGPQREHKGPANGGAETRGGA